MKLTKKQETEIWKVYNTWLNSYLNNDVETYDSYLADDYHFIGSTDNEEFLNRKDTTQFFKDTAEQFSGKTDLRKQTKTIEAFDDLIFITHLFDAWFINGADWTYYGRFRFSSVLIEKKEGWKFIYQHFSIADSKTDEGESIGFDKVNAESQELREAIKRRTIELEAKNRELEIEGALERIRAQAVAMQQSSDLLDIVVTMHNEFTKLGHEAHYFWHMMWLPDKYEKAMTSGDGTKIGFVMELPRHMHGDIPLLADWEKSDDDIVIYPMNAKAAINYVDKMVNLGDFQNIDPQAPTHDDIKHIGGLTFIMARTTHGEIGYSLPGVVKNPPAEDLDILVQFAGAFDLAHRRFLDLQKAEKQAREVQIELAIEKVRSRTMAMQHSDELQETSFLLDQQVRALGIKTWGCAFNIYGKKDSTEWFGNEKGVLPTYTVPRAGIFEDYYKKGKKGESLFVQEFDGKACVDHYEYMSTLPVIGDVLKKLKETNNGFPTYQIDHVVYFKYGYLLFITKEHVPDAYDIFKRFAKVFEQTYTRFLDLQKAEAQAKEAQIETALERVRSRSMAMHKSDELKDVVKEIFDQMAHLKINADHAGIVVDYEPKKDFHFWVADHQDIPAKITVPYLDLPWDRQFTEAKKKSTDFFTTQLNFEEKNSFYKKLLPHIEGLTKKAKDIYLNCPGLAASTVIQKDIGLYIENFSGLPFSDEENSTFMRFGKVFQQTYTRFLDLQKAEAQAKEAQIENALEKVRSRTMAMQNSSELPEAANNLFLQVQELGIPAWSAGYCIWEEDQKSATAFMSSEGLIQKPFVLPAIGVGYNFYKPLKNGDLFHVGELGGNLIKKHYEFMRTLPIFGEVIDGILEAGHPLPTFQIFHICYFKYGYVMFITYETVPKAHDIFKRFAKVFEQTYTRFLDLQKAEAQAKEAQIEHALEKVRSRTMAMQNSSELPEAANNLFLQIQELGIPAWSAGYCIWEDDQKSTSCNMSSEGEIQKSFSLPTVGEGYNFYKPLKNNEPFHVAELGGKALVKHYDFMKTLPGIGEVLEDFAKKGIELPTFQIFHIVYFTHGYLMFITYETVPNDWDVFKRFGKVFEQTYTRFLDLQKAEAQTKEAKIEAALEKVRSRTMAMQKGEEVKDVVVLLYKELITLGVTNFATCGYVEINEETQLQSTWVTSPGGDSLGLFYLPLTGDVYFDERYEAWKKQQNVFHQTVAGKVRRKHLEYAITTFNSKEAEEMVLNQFPDPTVFYCFNFSHGYLHLVSGSYLTEVEEALLARFTRVFEQTYARFLDLEKAEAQTRTAQINLAVERVRAKALAMHKSEEIMEVVAKLKDEVMALDIPDVVAATIFLNEGEDKVRMWDLSTLEKDSNGYQIPFDITFKLKKRDPNLYVKRVWDNPKDYFLEVQEAKDFKRIIAWLRENNKDTIANEVEEYTESTKLERLHHAVKKLNNGKLVIDLLNTPSEEMETILTKMGAAFDLAYKRFEDLQKAEAQVREAQIEAALERVRSRSMAMHKSEEMLAVIGVVSKQLQQLNLNFDTVSFAKNNQEGDFTFWITSKGQPKPLLMEVPTLDSPVLNGIYKAQKKGVTFLADVFSAKVNKEWHAHLIKYSDLKHFPDKIKDFVLKAPGFARSSFLLKNIDLYVGNYRAIPFTDEENSIFRRFAHVFEQSYTRFLDLQKAEAQAKEAQIEAALEKVRSRSLAMHKPDELQEVVAVVAEKLHELGVIFDAGGVILCTYFPDNKDVVHWIAVDDFSTSGRYLVPYFDNPIFSEAWDSKIKGDAYFSKEFPVEAKNDFFKQAFEHSDYKHMPEDYKQYVLKADKHNLSAAWSKNSAIIIPSLTGAILSESDAEILKRFANVFEQAYIRFMDLQKAEERARETKIDIALERVRSRTLAMQTSKELAETSMVVFQQLVDLGVAPNRLFIGIIKAKGASIEAWATNEDGSKIANQFTLHASKNKSIKKMITGWKQDKKSLVIDMKGKELQDYFQYLNKEMKIPFIHGLNQKRRVQTIAYFSEGLIGMAAPDEQSEDSIRLLERFASVFNLTYTRFKDLKIAEAQSKKAKEDLINLQLAKKSAEKALLELQQTQKQLIQSEKMASLGELTAGIAHEIQNPLNFVNNFSEVSSELIDEMNEEIEKGDLEEAKLIAKDIKENLEKINHHGKRADGIVKGMLQHSGSSSGIKEATDINALADEYLRLAYHGLRAKDKSFNATMKTEFDKTLKKVNVISQDIGRVILNLITNAFYAVDERKNQHIEGYEPTVSIVTKKQKNQVEIYVKDNGNGIQKHVLDKIFQPFFTTKPTGQGTGLGLSMSYDIIKAHGGELKVETKVGIGSEFIILFPIIN